MSVRSGERDRLPAVVRGPRPEGSPPQVLLVSPPVAPPWADPSAALARALAVAGRGYRYRVLGTRGQGSPGGAVRVEAVYSDAAAGAGGPSRADWLRVAARLLRPDRCAIHHFILPPGAFASRLGRVALRPGRRRSVQTLAGAPAASAALPELRFAERVVALSDATALWLRSAGVADVRVIRPAVALPDLPLGRKEARALLGAPWVGAAAEAPTFLYVGDLDRSDGAAVFVAAAERVRERHPEARFVALARPGVSALALGALSRRAAQAGLARHLTVVGPVHHPGALLAAVDAVVLAVSTLEGELDVPLALLQAMAHARPVVVSDLPSLGELAGLGQGAQVVRRGDPEALARALLALADDPAAADRLGRAARQTAAAHFSPERMVLAYEALYDALLFGR